MQVLGQEKVFIVVCRSDPDSKAAIEKNNSWPTPLAVCDSLTLARESIAAKIKIAPSWAMAEWHIEEHKLCKTTDEALLWHVKQHEAWL